MSTCYCLWFLSEFPVTCFVGFFFECPVLRQFDFFPHFLSSGEVYMLCTNRSTAGNPGGKVLRIVDPSFTNR